MKTGQKEARKERSMNLGEEIGLVTWEEDEFGFIRLPEEQQEEKEEEVILLEPEEAPEEEVVVR